MKTCKDCACSMSPLGYGFIHMTDGGTNKVVVLACPECREISMEYAKIQWSPPSKDGEKLKDYLERTL